MLMLIIMRISYFTFLFLVDCFQKNVKNWKGVGMQ